MSFFNLDAQLDAQKVKVIYTFTNRIFLTAMLEK